MFRVKALRITSNMHNCMANTLSNKNQRIVINENESDWTPTTSGG